MLWRNFQAKIIKPRAYVLTNKRILLVFVVVLIFPGGILLSTLFVPKVFFDVFTAVFLVSLIPILLFAARKERNKAEEAIGNFSWVDDKITIKLDSDKNGGKEILMDEIRYLNIYPKIMGRSNAIQTGLSGKCIVRIDLFVDQTHHRFHLLTEEYSYLILGDISKVWKEAGYNVNLNADA